MWSTLKTLQILWLLFCLTLVMGIGIYNLIQADKNQKAVLKPQKLWYAINYALGERQYEMPKVAITMDLAYRVPYDEMLTQLDVLKDNVVASYAVYGGDDDIDANLTIDMSRDSEQDRFVVVRLDIYFEGRGPEARARPGANNLTATYVAFGDISTFEVEGLNVGFYRDPDGTFMDRAYLPFQIDSHYMLQYKEKVVHTYDGSTISEISQSTSQIFQDFTDSDTSFSLWITIFPIVEHWQEYVEYGYTDWFTGMAGLISLAITIFLFEGKRFFVKDQVSIAPVTEMEITTVQTLPKSDNGQVTTTKL